MATIQRIKLFKRKQLPPRPAIVYRPVSGGTAARIDDTVNAQPKTKPQRSPNLLGLAKGEQCLLRIPGVCVGGTESTVACHSNKSEHGKGAHRKANDQYSVWGCWTCHGWLDTDNHATAEQRAKMFDAAHLLQITHWHFIATDGTQPVRNRRAARWALDLLQRTP